MLALACLTRIKLRARHAHDPFQICSGIGITWHTKIKRLSEKRSACWKRQRKCRESESLEPQLRSQNWFRRNLRGARADQEATSSILIVSRCPARQGSFPNFAELRVLTPNGPRWSSLALQSLRYNDFPT